MSFVCQEHTYNVRLTIFFTSINGKYLMVHILRLTDGIDRYEWRGGQGNSRRSLASG